jgi:hypothetical protein
MKMKMRKKFITWQPFYSGQIWRWNDSSVQIQSVGKTLVHYKHYKGGNKRPPILLSTKGVLDRFLQANDAILELSCSTLATGGQQIQFGRKSHRQAEAKEN